jgi:hypothetical protein
VGSDDDIDARARVHLDTIDLRHIHPENQVVRVNLGAS